MNYSLQVIRVYPLIASRDNSRKGWKIRKLIKHLRFLALKLNAIVTTNLYCYTKNRTLRLFLNLFWTSDCRSMSTLIEDSLKSDSFLENSEDAKDSPHRHAIGSVMYLKIETQPDVAFSVQKLAQFPESSLQHHWVTINLVPRLISRTRGHGILFEKYENLQALGCCESDRA